MRGKGEGGEGKGGAGGVKKGVWSSHHNLMNREVVTNTRAGEGRWGGRKGGEGKRRGGDEGRGRESEEEREKGK